MATPRQTGVRISGGWEPDALTSWRRLLRFRPGKRKAAKKSYNRRIRRRPVELDDEDDDRD